MQSWSFRRIVFWHVLERISSWVRRTNSADAQKAQERGEVTDTALFHCARCDVTFISREMEACPRCDRQVEEIPSEREVDRYHVH